MLTVCAPACVSPLLISSVCLSDPYAPPFSSSTAACPPVNNSHPSSSIPGTVDAALPSQLPATNAAAAATGVSLPVNDGAQSNGHTEAPYNTTTAHTAAASHLPSSLRAPTPPTTICTACGALQSPGTKHCYVDGRCVPGFDHHCVYLNTCVGERNYWLFFIFVSHVTALMIFQLFVTLWLLAHYQHDDYRQAVETSHLKHPLAWLILLTCVAVLPFLCLASIASLQCFHCYLVGSHQTTYQFIIARRQLMQQRWEEQQQRQWQAEGRAPGADGPVLSAKQQREQAEWMRERQRQQGRKQRVGSLANVHQAQQYAHAEGANQQPEPPQLSEEIRSV